MYIKQVSMRREMDGSRESHMTCTWCLFDPDKADCSDSDCSGVSASRHGPCRATDTQRHTQAVSRDTCGHVTRLTQSHLWFCSDGGCSVITTSCKQCLRALTCCDWMKTHSELSRDGSHVIDIRVTWLSETQLWLFCSEHNSVYSDTTQLIGSVQAFSYASCPHCRFAQKFGFASFLRSY